MKALFVFTFACFGTIWLCSEVFDSLAEYMEERRLAAQKEELSEAEMDYALQHLITPEDAQETHEKVESYVAPVAIAETMPPPVEGVSPLIEESDLVRFLHDRT